MRNPGNILVLLLLHVALYLNGPVEGLKDVVLEIEPRVVQRGESSTLECVYNLEGAQLYTVKWYRGHHEFYRYTPSELPHTKVFPFPGVHVDVAVSNNRQVVLRKVGFNLSGNFSCEVTTEEPFSTAVVSKEMLVVVLPETPPTLNADKSFYLYGDILKANCTSPPSRPAATLTFFMNNIAVCEKCETRKHVSQDLFWSDLSLELPLFPSHFSGGRLILRCVAQVADMYQQDTELRLDNAKDPVPERVTSPNSATASTTISLARLSLFLYIILNLR
ncbi:PREDICTED: uncharacterized protein LOC108559490 isoform X2 [Nicrophorus vespilloides]|uniref:Uncharacterized protein LOC108559490 isoform X2 n=1 Tax=Nicrophorus vespilloides TaxID=110193 RepID=A0ABM1MCI7_NICVS|nr:PREDICTED: uncharacterized protein LOC108559490 isoform X2 [Nicrophorus vespilloides]